MWELEKITKVLKYRMINSEEGLDRKRTQFNFVELILIKRKIFIVKQKRQDLKLYVNQVYFFRSFN